jgi:hypothetical protein
MSRNYVIIDASEVSSVDFNQVLETSAETLLYNLAGTQTFVKFEGSAPAFLAGKPAHSHAEILEILSGSEWTAPMEEL